MSKKRRSASRSSSASSASSSQQVSSTSQASSTPTKSSTTQAKSSSSKSQAQQPKKRSIAYIIAVVYVILHGLFWTAVAFSTYRANVDKYPVLFGLLIVSTLLSLAAGFGMWFWKKWAGYLYLVTGMAMGLLVTMLSGDLWLALGSFMPVIVVLYVVYPKLME
jgi:cation transport ATPase